MVGWFVHRNVLVLEPLILRGMSDSYFCNPAPATTQTLLHNLHQLHPPLMAHLPDLRFIEQYDPSDENVKGQPYAYVADMVHEIQLGVDVDEVRGRGVKNEQWAALVELRDKLCPGEKVAWYVVVCGDEERWAPSLTPTPSSTTFHSQRSTYQSTHQSNGSRVGSARQRSESQSMYEHKSQGSRTGRSSPDTRQGQFSRQSRESGDEVGGRKVRRTTYESALEEVQAQALLYRNAVTRSPGDSRRCLGAMGNLSNLGGWSFPTVAQECADELHSVKDSRAPNSPRFAYSTPVLPPPLPGTAR